MTLCTYAHERRRDFFPGGTNSEFSKGMQKDFSRERPKALQFDFTHMKLREKSFLLKI